MFCAIDVAIAKRRIEGRLRQVMGHHVQILSRLGRQGSKWDTSRDSVITILQQLQICRRDRDAPVTRAIHGRHIVFAVQGHDKRNAGAVQAGDSPHFHRLLGLSRAQMTIGGQDCNRYSRLGGINGNRLTSGNDLTAFLRVTHGHDLRTVSQRLQICRRDLHAPQAIAANRRKIGFTI